MVPTIIVETNLAFVEMIAEVDCTSFVIGGRLYLPASDVWTDGITESPLTDWHWDGKTEFLLTDWHCGIILSFCCLSASTDLPEFVRCNGGLPNLKYFRSLKYQWFSISYGIVLIESSDNNLVPRQWTLFVASSVMEFSTMASLGFTSEPPFSISLITLSLRQQRQ